VTRETFLSSDPQKSLEVIRRDDEQGNQAGGFTVFDGSWPRITLAFPQARGRAVVEALAKVFGGTVTWGRGE
jgi:hypothetical protein